MNLSGSGQAHDGETQAASARPAGGCRVMFGWVSPMVATGYRRQLHDPDLAPPQPNATPDACADALWQQWTQVRQKMLQARLGLHV